MPETGQPQTRLGNEYLSSELNLDPEPGLTKIPLLYTLVANTRKRNVTAKMPSLKEMDVNKAYFKPSNKMDTKHMHPRDEGGNLDFTNSSKVLEFSREKGK
eukprot:CAMPEP_0184486172 /NCGR_PEP_ID=MMETSP0113_2-20130426/7708_1 /TAXON_ID=91329 /ORGANISM="Norrisiella sphaerica, Strain BC52" /LENGTH=100 /DNA_ID=CAMNT_0026867921 /DNA_START=87 /DNA_END=389 /DNA_ORIENTATION=-